MAKRINRAAKLVKKKKFNLLTKPGYLYILWDNKNVRHSGVEKFKCSSIKQAAKIIGKRSFWDMEKAIYNPENSREEINIIQIVKDNINHALKNSPSRKSSGGGRK